MPRARPKSIVSGLIVLGLCAATALPWPRPAESVQTDRPGTAGAAVTPATLVIWNRPIVVFRVPVNRVSPAERIAVAARRFETLPDDVRADEISTAPATAGGLRGMVVVARDQVLFAILEDEVDPTAGETLADVSGHAVAQLRAVIEARAEQRRPVVILRGVGLSLGARAILLLILWAIWRLAERALLRLAAAASRRAASVLGLDFRRPLEALEHELVRLTAWGLGLLATYLWLAFTLRQFPYTRPWAERLRASLFELFRELGAGALQAVPGLLAVAAIFLAARFMVWAVDVFFRAVERDVVKLGSLQPDTARATRRLLSVAIWIFALTVAYEYIPGSDRDAFKAIGVLVGVMISLGSAGLVNQLMVRPCDRSSSRRPSHCGVEHGTGADGWLAFARHRRSPPRSPYERQAKRGWT